MFLSINSSHLLEPGCSLPICRTRPDIFHGDLFDRMEVGVRGLVLDKLQVLSEFQAYGVIDKFALHFGLERSNLFHLP